jgi:hypothetical protein
MDIWTGSPPETCDLCGTMIEKAFVDGALKHGPWAIMCPFCALAHGVGLGEGKGQLYTECTNTGMFVKLKG